ncbi:MAG TPA: GAF domain-containing SpoIIE family protein phosphatase [Acidimicrobiales bacterium]
MSAESSTVVSGPNAPAGPDPGGDAPPAGRAEPVLVLGWDGEGRCTLVHRGDGRDDPTLAAVHGHGWRRLLHPDHRGHAEDLIGSVLAGGGAREAVVRLDPGDRWAVLRVTGSTPDPVDVPGSTPDPVDVPGDTAPPGGVRADGATGVLVDATGSLATTARMARLVAAFNGVRRTDEVVAAMLDEGMALLGGNTAVLHLLSDAADELVLAGTAGLPEEEVRQRFGHVPLTSPLPTAEVLRTGHTVAVASHDERRRRFPDLETLAIDHDPAFVVVPLEDALGQTFGTLAVGFPDERHLRAGDRALLGDAAAQCALALDRARLAARAERDQERLTFLDAVSGAMSSSLRLDETLARLTEMTVPRLADWSAVRLVSRAADPEPVVGVAHVDPESVDRLHEMVRRLPRELETSGELGSALQEGRPLVRSSGAEALFRLAGPTPDDDPDRRCEGGEHEATVAVFPLRARGRLLGALAFGNRPGRPMSPDELDLAEAVAARAAVLVDNARLFDEQSRVARALQDSLLPGSLPEIPGIELGARYRAAGQGLDVGGDFYDAFQADENWWIVAVGDVCGHGVEAAATTGLVRHTIRSAAMAGVMPSAILGRLNDLLLRHSAERELTDDQRPASPRFCTVLVGAVQPTATGVDLVLCAGGHPLPLVRRADGRIEAAGAPGTLVGVTDEVRWTDAVVHLDPGETLVCYTDGLTDRRSDRQAFGEEGVIEALGRGAGLSADELVRLIEVEAVGRAGVDLDDDMAVLALQARPAGDA